MEGKISSPEELDRRLTVVTPKNWLALTITGLLILGVILWAFLGTIPNTFETKTIFLNREGFEIVKSLYSGKVKEVFVTVNQEVAKNQTLASIEKASGETWTLKAAESGKVIELFIGTGGTVGAGDPLMLIQKQEGDFEFFAFVSLERAQQLKRGMRVYVKPEGVDIQRYGSIVAEISAISPYVISEGELLHLLGNRLLIPYFTKNEPVALVTITPQKDSQTGFVWTSGEQPLEPINPQTMGSALFILSSKRPIMYVFPLLQKEA